MSSSPHDAFVKTTGLLLTCVVTILLMCIGLCLIALKPELLEPRNTVTTPTSPSPANANKRTDLWQAPDSLLMAKEPNGELVQYGFQLVSHTAAYLGPKGKVAAISNGMNCQNCHLRAGRKIFGNNYSAVASTFPKFRARSGSVETIAKRVNDCIQRSLNGHSLADDSRELKAFIAYIQWVGKDVEKGKSPYGVGLWDLPLMTRAADSVKGHIVYKNRCEVCHGPNGMGQKNPDGIEWKYPPLYGADSYNSAAGLFRLSRFAGFVKANMPNGVTYETPVLTDEEAWDVAAYVNSLPRPQKTFSQDWPDIATKPFDHPFGPFADTFPAIQHKLGPFAALKKSQKK